MHLVCNVHIAKMIIKEALTSRAYYINYIIVII